MDCNDVKPGIFVRTNKKVAEPGATTGMMIAGQYLDNRKVGIVGQVQQYVPGHGGDVWFVRHEDGKVAAYGFPEMERVEVG